MEAGKLRKKQPVIVFIFKESNLVFLNTLKMQIKRAYYFATKLVHVYLDTFYDNKA